MIDYAHTIEAENVQDRDLSLYTVIVQTPEGPLQNRFSVTGALKRMGPDKHQRMVAYQKLKALEAINDRIDEALDLMMLGRLDWKEANRRLEEDERTFQERGYRVRESRGEWLARLADGLPAPELSGK